MRLDGLPLTFAVTHVGRGGDVTCQCDAGVVELPIEMQAGGNFSVWLRGTRLLTTSGKRRRLRTDERHFVLERLRTWLDDTGRDGWVIE